MGVGCADEEMSASTAGRRVTLGLYCSKLEGGMPTSVWACYGLLLFDRLMQALH